MSENVSLLTDFTKIHCPFVRQTFAANKAQWKKHGSKLKMKEAQAYLVVNRVNPGYQWVFEDAETFAVEKLDGSNIKILTEGGRLIAVQNRKNVIDPLQVMKGKTFIIEGIFQAIGKGYVNIDGEQAGELIGPKLQGNPYQQPVHLWYPFEKAIQHLRYKSFEQHERNFENWNSWFEEWLFSRFFTKYASKLGLKQKVMAEGVIFYNLRRKEEGKTYMAKLRRDMFDWFYSPKVEIVDYDPSGNDQVEDQEKFD